MRGSHVPASTHHHHRDCQKDEHRHDENGCPSPAREPRFWPLLRAPGLLFHVFLLADAVSRIVSSVRIVRYILSRIVSTV